MTDATSLDQSVPGLGAPAENPKPGEPRSAQSWLDAIRDAEKFFHDYQVRADNIDKQFANLERLAATTRDREIQLFWANISVMGPSIYSRPPVPVVIPRWKQRDDLSRTASEMLERATIVTFECEEVDYVMRQIRDDLVIVGRGVPWLRYDTTKGKKRVCIDHADRKDFLHEPARNWKEVDWAGKRSWLTQEEAKKRFAKTSKDAYKTLDYAVRKDAKSDNDDGKEKAGVWEIWCKSENRVYWVAEGCTVLLDEGPPHLTLESFFPCPRPAFGTLERRSLRPVPDFVFYKDQLEEINEITARIAALTEAVRVRGFYPVGAGEIGDAIEAALKSTTNNQVMIPVSNWSALGGTAPKDTVVWLPIDVITATITAIIAIRKQLMEDVYEVTGLSDIMRGQTEASETLGAQQLKSQYGSVRIKDKQNELTRVARDVTHITAEIIADNFDGETLMDMTQLRLPSDREIEAQAKPLQAQLQQIQKELPALQEHLQGLQAEVQSAQSDPEIQQAAQANPAQTQQIIQTVQQHLQETQAKVQQMQQQGPQLEAQLKKLAATVTIDKVLKLFEDNAIRPFILDIETDSTIAPDENASKQQAQEALTAIGGYLKNALPEVSALPPAAPLVSSTLKYLSDQFRLGREMENAIDTFADAMEAKAQEPPPPDPAQLEAQQKAQEVQHKQQMEAQRTAADAAAKQAQAAKDQADAEAQAADTQRLALEAQTAAKDADAKRRIDLAREMDASAARRAEIEQKAASAVLERELKKDAAALEIAHRQAAHEQQLDKGALDIANSKLEIAKKEQAMQHADQAHERATQAHAQSMQHADAAHKRSMEAAAHAETKGAKK